MKDNISLEKMHGRAAKEWRVPQNDKAREYALDEIISSLNEGHNLKVGTYVTLQDKAIRWLIKET